MPRDESAPSPSAEQLVLSAIAVAVHGPYCSARDRLTVLHPFTGPMSHNGVALQAEVILRTAVRAWFAALPPQDLAQISQALEQARAKWPPRFEEQGGDSHLRPV